MFKPIQTFFAASNSFSSTKLEGDLGKLKGIQTFGDFFVILTNILYVSGIALSMLFVIIGGIKIVTSTGNEQKLVEGRNTVMFSVLGLICVLGFRIIVNFILSIFGFASIEDQLK